MSVPSIWVLEVQTVGQLANMLWIAIEIIDNHQGVPIGPDGFPLNRHFIRGRYPQLVVVDRH